jgi:aspartate-semialdehyde dehydrogenase
VSSGYSIGVIGATGVVGTEFLRILETRKSADLPVKSLRLFATKRSAGKRLTVLGEEHVVEESHPDPRQFEGLDFVITAVGDGAAKEYAPVVAAAGALDVDKSNAFRMDPNVPLVIPEVNPEDARQHRGIIAGPNCSTTQMAVALWPLHRVNPIQRIVVSTYQSVSGTGRDAMEELRAQNEAVANGRAVERAVYPYQIAQNLIPEIGSLKADGHYSEEQKMVDETRKMFHAPDLPISATCVRVPVAVGHSESINVDFTYPMSPEEAREILSRAPGVTVVDNPAQHGYPTPLECAGRDGTFVGRIRRDTSSQRGLAMWVVSDNLRKGAALNAIQVFELVARNGWQAGAREAREPALAGARARA